MCLFVNWYTTRKRAKEDIIVYKVVRKDWQIKNAYRTFYREELVCIGDTQVAKSLRKTYNSGFKEWNDKYTSWTIEEGIHSIASLKDAMNTSHWYSHFIILKCIIPKGELYYKGLWYNQYDEKMVGYTSKSLKLIEIAKYE